MNASFTQAYLRVFGFPLIEAWYFNKPIIASNASCLPEIGGDAVLYIDPHSPESIETGISRLVTNESLRTELVIKGQKRIKNFTWSKSARKHLEAFEALV